MNKPTLIVLIFFLPTFFTTALAQNHIGFGGGINIAGAQTTWENRFVTTDGKIGPSIRAFAEIGLFEKLSIQPELNFIRKGFRMYFPNFDDVNLPKGLDKWYRLDYLNLDFLTKYYFLPNSMQKQRLARNKFKWNGYVLGGVYIGLLGDRRVVYGEDFPEGSNSFFFRGLANWDLGALVGLGAVMNRNRFSIFIETRYAHGLLRLNEREYHHGNLRNLSVGLETGFKFRI